MKKIIAALTLSALLSLPVSAVSISRPALTDDEIKQTILNAATWMQTQQEENGHMHYEYIPFLDRYTDDDNMVRQAGALYEMGELFVRMEKDTLELEDSIIKAISYFKENSYEGEYDGLKFSCVVKDAEKCSLGGTALALIGVLDMMELSDRDQHSNEELVESYKNFIVAMSLSNGGYRDSYGISTSQSNSQSSFSNGEAFLALVRYYKYNKAPEIKEMIDQSFDYFVKEYGEENWDPNFYLWGMAAIKDLYAISPDQKYVDYVKNYTDWRIKSKKNNRYTTHNYCAYIEGVVSAYSVIQPNLTKDQLAYYDEEIDFWLAKSKDLQVDLGDIFQIGFADGQMFWLSLKNSYKSIGGFLTDFKEPVQRIDFTQHCMSSYLQKYVDIDGNQL